MLRNQHMLFALDVGRTRPPQPPKTQARIRLQNFEATRAAAASVRGQQFVGIRVQLPNARIMRAIEEGIVNCPETYEAETSAAT